MTWAAGGYFHHPALHGDTRVFTAEGDLWKASVNDGTAQRLTTHAEAKTHAAISPDGQWLAFPRAMKGPWRRMSCPSQATCRND